MSYLLIGLGNPGKKFESTRHNVGKLFIRWMNKGQGLRDKGQGGFEAIETECFMNESGGWVKRWLKKSGLLVIGYWSRIKAKGQGDTTLPKSQRLNQQPTTNNQQPALFIVHDDLDIPLGKFKIQFGKGPRLHNGVLSVEQALGTKEFWRVRIGVDNRKKMTNDELRMTNDIQHSTFNIQHYSSGEDYVLEKFRPEEKKVLESVFPEVSDRLSSLSFLRKQESI